LGVRTTMVQEYEYVDDMGDHLLESLQNQKLTDEQLQSIEEADNFRDKTIAVLKTVHDPEIPVNIWDLGLIYTLSTSDANDIDIHMTLTAPTCPIAEAIPVEVEKRLKEHLKEVGTISVELIWEPAWEKSMMSDEAKLILDMW